MKSVLAFLLLIGICCQIGQGDCAPAEDTYPQEIKSLTEESMGYVSDTYNKYMPDLTQDMPAVPDSIKKGYEIFKGEVSNIAEGVGSMTKSAIDSISKAL